MKLLDCRHGDRRSLHLGRVRGHSAVTALALATVAGSAFSLATAAATLPFSEVDAGPLSAVTALAYSAAWGDFDLDGRPDPYLSTLFNAPAAFFRNTPDGFVAVTDGTIGTDIASRAGAVWTDVENDGDLDLFVGTSASENDLLYRNQGDGTFVSDLNPPFSATGGLGQSAVAGDFNRDGWIDFFVPNGGGFQPEADLLLRGLGGGAFARDTDGVVAEDVLNSVGGAAADYDGDGWLDLFVANIWGRGSLFHNRGDGSFERVLTGPIAEEAAFLGSASAAWGDYDNDGDLDLLVVHGDPGHGLYRNDGDGIFTRLDRPPLTTSRGLCVGGVFADFDNDGWLDVLIARRQSGQLLFRGTGDGRFESITNGPIANRANGANGVALADYDLDGDLDVLLTNWEGQGSPSLYRNEATGNAWLRLRLDGRFSNRAGIGARVRVKATIGGQTVWQLRQVGGEDAQGSQELVAHFGLGDAGAAEVVRIEWPSGLVQEFSQVTARQTLLVTETEFQPLGGITLNRQTGLYEHRVRFTRFGGSATDQVRIVVSGLPADVTLPNALGQDGDGHYFQLVSAPPKGGQADLTLTFRQPNRTGFTAPTYLTRYGTWDAPATPEGPRFSVDRTRPLPAGGLLVEFVSEPGARYGIEYSEDLVTWTPAATAVLAGGTRTQWIDQGPPETRSVPPAEAQRFYRAIRLGPSAP